MIELIEALDVHFAWMLGPGRPVSCGGLTQPHGGVESADVLALLRGIAHDHRVYAARGMWLVVRDGEVAGLCGYLARPKDGTVEIGYGIAASCRRQGLATQAVAALVRQAVLDGIRVVGAATAIDNLGSQRVLERNGFRTHGRRHDPEDGELLEWSLHIGP